MRSRDNHYTHTRTDLQFASLFPHSLGLSGLRTFFLTGRAPQIARACAPGPAAMAACFADGPDHVVDALNIPAAAAALDSRCVRWT